MKSGVYRFFGMLANEGEFIPFDPEEIIETAKKRLQMQHKIYPAARRALAERPNCRSHAERGNEGKRGRKNMAYRGHAPCTPEDQIFKESNYHLSLRTGKTRSVLDWMLEETLPKPKWK